MKKSIILAACVTLLSGCASFQQAMDAYGSAAVASTQHANDQIIAAWTLQACSTPVSAALRNPQIIGALRYLCVPQNTMPPASLLDSLEAAPMRAAK